MLAYFDCFSGISGDMTLGALIDLGVPVKHLERRLKSIPLKNFDLAVTPVHRNGIRAMSIIVDIYDDQYARNFADIRSLIHSCPLSEKIKSISIQIFTRLAASEAHIHNCSLEQVHFHEVGGIDAIVDIVGTAICLDYLGIKRIIASHIPLGKGFVTCSHGKLPVPAPATIDILKGAPVYGTDVPHELVTPTGAAIIVTLAERFGALPHLIMKGTGYGAGHRELEERPNLLRIVTGTQPEATESLDETTTDHVFILETCIDDMNPELFGYLMDRLFIDGALDVYWIPVYMKKNRPGTMLQVLCHPTEKDSLIRRILSETTTLGVRYYESHRRLLWRDQLKVKTIYGDIPVKRIKDPQGNIRTVPEYDVCEKIAREQNIPIRIVYETITREAGARMTKINLG
jgi:pyridinium-3,5-bisthiocarboxylic acid mononucleotide nickel chelatase